MHMVPLQTLPLPLLLMMMMVRQARVLLLMGRERLVVLQARALPRGALRGLPQGPPQVQPPVGLWLL